MRPIHFFAFAALMPIAVHCQAAICVPGIAHYRYVGDMASDAKCTDNDIQTAIDNATCPGTTIVITREHTYTAQALQITGNSLTLTGVGDGVACGSNPIICDPDIGCTGNPPPTTPLVTLDGTGNNNGQGGRVLSIGGNSNVTLRYLEIKGGDLTGTTTGDGGGIGFEGTGSLTLDTSTVDNNCAEYGGGINFKGTGNIDNNDPPALLTLDHYTQILSNSAVTSGGGIRIEGDAQLLALQPQTLIFHNQAPGGYGGGIEVLGPALATLGSPGYNGLPFVDYNDAEYGGGIAIIGFADTGGNAEADIFSTDPQHPIAVSNNTATKTGGGIFVQPNTSGPNGVNGAEAELCAISYRIDDNVAAEGAAIYGDTDAYNSGLDSLGARIYLFNVPDRDPCNKTQYGAVACSADTLCNTVNDNADLDGNGNPTSGSIILVQDDGALGVYGLRMQNNRGAHALRLLDSANADIQDCLLTDNTFSSDLLHLEGGTGPFVSSVRGCTIANNSLGGNSLIDSSHDLSLSESILGDLIQPATLENGATLYPGSLLTADTQGLPPYTSIVQGSASFVDAVVGNYHLLPTSLGIDFAVSGGGVDLDGRPRDVDLATVPNIYGPRDLGAFERQSALACDDNADAIFCNGFEP